MTTKYIEIDRAIETALLLLEEGEDEQTLAYNAALVAFIKNMENVPAADVEPRWIPVTERLPEKYGQYLVTFIPSGGTLWTKVLIAFYSDLMGIAKPSFHIGEVGKDSFFNINEQVIAWMPLPTPYKGGEEE